MLITAAKYSDIPEALKVSARYEMVDLFLVFDRDPCESLYAPISSTSSPPLSGKFAATPFPQADHAVTNDADGGDGEE